MAFKIERALTGLFGGYKLQSQGNLPYLMREDVQPVIDLNQWALHSIGLQVQDLAQGAIAIPGVLGTFTQTVDWLVIGCQAETTAGGVGDSASLLLNWVPNGSSVAFDVCSVQRNGSAIANWAFSAAGETYISNNCLVNTPFFSPAGSIWTTIITQTVVAVGPAGRTSALFYELRRA